MTFAVFSFTYLKSVQLFKNFKKYILEIRLAGGPSESTGRVEIYHDGAWGTVCADE